MRINTPAYFHSNKLSKTVIKSLWLSTRPAVLGSFTSLFVSTSMVSVSLPKRLYPVETVLMSVLAAILADESSRKAEKYFLKNKHYSSECFYQELLSLFKNRFDLEYPSISSGYDFTLGSLSCPTRNVYEYDLSTLNNVDWLLDGIGASLERVNYLCRYLDEQHIIQAGGTLRHKVTTEFHNFETYLGCALRLLENLKESEILEVDSLNLRKLRLKRYRAQIHSLMRHKARLIA